MSSRNRRERREARAGQDTPAEPAGTTGPPAQDDTNDHPPTPGDPGGDTAGLAAVGGRHGAGPAGDDDRHDENDGGSGVNQPADQRPDQPTTDMTNAELIAYRRTNPLMPQQEFDDQVHHELLDQRRSTARFHWRNTVPWMFQDAPQTTLNVPGVEQWTRDRIAEAYARRQLTLRQAPSLLLVGGTGTGKTHAAWWVIGHLAKSGVITDWEVANSVKMYQSLRPEEGVNTAALLRRYCRVPLLVIDDAGASAPTSFTHEMDYSIINYRYEYGLPVIVTTNLAPERDDSGPKPVLSLEDRMSVRVYSRLANMVGDNTFSLGLWDRRFGDEPRGGNHGGARS